MTKGRDELNCDQPYKPPADQAAGLVQTNTRNRARIRIACGFVVGCGMVMPIILVASAGITQIGWLDIVISAIVGAGLAAILLILVGVAVGVISVVLKILGLPVE